MSLLPQYRHVINPKLKHTYLTFDGEGNLIVKSPKVSQKYIERLLLKKSGWINRSREKLVQKKGKSPNFSRQEKLFFQGRSYLLILKEHSKKRVLLTFNEKEFVLCYSKYDETIFQKHIDKFYRQKAEKLIPPLVDKWANIMQLDHGKISFRKNKRQWGSCSHKNDLSFNTMTMKLPTDVAEYIIVHELAHIRHKHHQKDFWALVAKYMPNYKQLIAELKTYTTH